MDDKGHPLTGLAVKPVNESDMIILPESLQELINISKEVGFTLKGSIINLDSGFDSKNNRKKIWNRQMIPNIKENPRNRKKLKRGRKRFFNQDYYDRRFICERTFGWEDSYRRLVIRYEIKQANHLGFKHLAYSLINLRDVFTTQ